MNVNLKCAQNAASIFIYFSQTFFQDTCLCISTPYPIMNYRTDYTCPLELTHDIIRGKWKPIILWQLNKGTSSLSSLEKSILGISRKMLIQHLKELAE